MARHSDGLCPNCNERERAPGQSYCRPCWRAYARQRYHDKKGADWQPKYHNYLKAENDRLCALVRQLGGDPDAR